ncbi:MarR family winged helix-turn-helix transcriptional regulator [Microlunatus soli]|uniref:DNA-binding transcriptional regulator, MarR family n=1 Tax=Microlunatus soli TaxID=630515 RepID=A0A1H1RKY9_9ACTN|nr:MarR family transcriptional regulator [Microlunatus soli]SDS36370.1 DNA-binding transcriptional regulator, MarR family [Microlunatus soli]
MDADLVTRLRRVVGQLTRELNVTSTGEGLTPTQASVLGQIVTQGPMKLAELIDRERLNPTMMSRVVGKLVDQGLIVRTADPSDLRSVSVSGTERGRDIHDRIRSRRAALVADCVRQLPQAESDAISAAVPALEMLVAALAADARPD